MRISIFTLGVLCWRTRRCTQEEASKAVGGGVYKVSRCSERPGKLEIKDPETWEEESWGSFIRRWRVEKEDRKREKI